MGPGARLALKEAQVGSWEHIMGGLIDWSQ